TPAMSMYGPRPDCMTHFGIWMNFSFVRHLATSSKVSRTVQSESPPRVALGTYKNRARFFRYMFRILQTLPAMTTVSFLSSSNESNRLTIRFRFRKAVMYASLWIVVMFG